MQKKGYCICPFLIFSVVNWRDKICIHETNKQCIVAFSVCVCVCVCVCVLGFQNRKGIKWSELLGKSFIAPGGEYWALSCYEKLNRVGVRLRNNQILQVYMLFSPLSKIYPLGQDILHLWTIVLHMLAQVETLKGVAGGPNWINICKLSVTK